jgi:hypothetical protein
MKYLIITFFLCSAKVGLAQFGTCNCTVNIPNNSGNVNFSSLSFTGTGCPSSGAASYTGNLCILNLGGNSTVVMDKNFTVNGDFRVVNSGSNSVFSIPSGFTLTVNGDFGDDSNNNVTFRVNGSLVVQNGIYGKNSNAFDATGTGTGSISAGSLNFQGAPSCISPTDCSGINWNVTTCSPTPSTFCTNVIALPVQLLYFNAKLINSEVELSWATASEQNASHFSVERSADGQIWTEIAKVNAAGNSVTRIEYTNTDKNPLVGRSYYRLKQVDFDGYTEYFNIRFIDFNAAKGVSVYPNPYNQAQILTISVNFLSDEKNYVTITTIGGTVISRFSFHGTETRLPVELTKGTYVVTVFAGNKNYTTRFVVH